MCEILQSYIKKGREDAIGLKGIGLEDDGVALPVPSDANAAINKAKADIDIYDYSKGIVTYVDVDFSAYRKNG